MFKDIDVLNVRRIENISQLKKGQVVLMVDYDASDFCGADPYGWICEVCSVVAIGLDTEGHVGQSFLSDLPNVMLERIYDRREGATQALGGSLGHLHRLQAYEDSVKTFEDFEHLCGEGPEFQSRGGYSSCVVFLLHEHGLVEFCSVCDEGYPVEEMTRVDEGQLVCDGCSKKDK